MVMKSLMKMTGSEWGGVYKYGSSQPWFGPFMADRLTSGPAVFFILISPKILSQLITMWTVEGQRSFLNDYQRKICLDNETQALKSEHVSHISDTHISLIRESDASLLSTSRQHN